jgi:translation initiation factor IF-1
MKQKRDTEKGVVLEALPNTKFRVQIEDKTEINAYLAGKLRIHRIKIFPGDKVTIERDDYDRTKGRIVYRG